jgi:DNA-binding beta-propeller fold protein YncE
MAPASLQQPGFISRYMVTLLAPKKSRSAPHFDFLRASRYMNDYRGYLIRREGGPSVPKQNLRVDHASNLDVAEMFSRKKSRLRMTCRPPGATSLEMNFWVRPRFRSRSCSSLSTWRLREDGRTIFRPVRLTALILALTSLSSIVALPQQVAAEECAYVLNFDSDSITVISTRTNSILGTMHLPGYQGCDVEQPPLGVKPWRFALNADGSRAFITTGVCFLYVADPSEGWVGVTPTRHSGFEGFEGLYQIALTADGTSLYVGDHLGVAVFDVETASEVAHVALPSGRLDDIEPAEGQASIYLAGTFLYRVDTTTAQIVQSFGDDGFWYRDLAIASDAGLLYASGGPRFGQPVSQGVYVFDRNTGYSLEGFIPYPYAPHSIAVSPDGQDIFISASLGVEVFSVGEVVPKARIEVSGGADRLRVTSDGTRLYATSADDTITVLDAQGYSLLDTIPLTECGRVHYNPPFFDDPWAPCSPVDIAIAPCPCTGDCDGDGIVEVNELVGAVNLALGIPFDCRRADVNYDRTVTIEELVRAVNLALNGCS